MSEVRNAENEDEKRKAIYIENKKASMKIALQKEKISTRAILKNFWVSSANLPGLREMREHRVRA